MVWFKPQYLAFEIGKWYTKSPSWMYDRNCFYGNNNHISSTLSPLADEYIKHTINAKAWTTAVEKVFSVMDLGAMLFGVHIRLSHYQQCEKVI